MMNRVLYIVSVLTLIGCNQVQENPNSEEDVESKVISHSDIKDFLKPQHQTFHWTAQSDTILNCEQGTKIYLPNNCFNPTHYNSDSLVIIEVTEYYRLSDFISEGLTTISGNNILETGGMINIRVHQNEKDLLFAKGQEYAVLFPKQNESEELMSTFYGERDSNDAIIWKPEEIIKQSNNDLISPEPLTTCRFKQTARSAKIGDEEVEWKLKETGEYAPDYIDRNIKPSQKMIDDFCDLNLNPRYKIQYDKNGSVRDIKIEQGSTKDYDKVICDFIRNMPQVDMTSMPRSYPDMYYNLEFKGWERTSFDNESYKKKFESKYSKFRDEVVRNIKNAELNYYILTASKFGWINCDRFWNTDNEKIDYLVEIENIDAVNLNLVFSDINSIMPAVKHGNKYLFKNVPLGREVKLVGVGYEGEFATMAVSTTTISKKSFNLSGFKNFKLSELEKELNSI